ncbi:MAG: hypothetical protein AMXMBFR83_28930 [Phycisphaerae bacterium]
MTTRIRKLDPDGDRMEAVREAALCLADGGVVVFPTETVYGVGADASNPRALKRLREVKGRNESKPFTVHVGSRQAVERFVPNLSGLGRRLTEKAWPGPLTIVFHVDDIAAAPVLRETSPQHAEAIYHDGTVGIRCPDDRVALDLLTAAGVPVVASSANPATLPAPTSAEEVLATLDGKVDLILDTGRTRYAKPSTIIEVRGDRYTLLREGVMDERTIRRLTQVNFLVVCSGNTCRSPMAEGLLRRLLAEKLAIPEADLAVRGYNVESAGASAVAGLSPTPAAVRVLKARGIDISTHQSRPLLPDMALRADHVFAMTQGHEESVLRLCPQARGRVRMLADHDIEDPIGEGDQVYAEVAGDIEAALRKRLEEITL